MGATPTIATSAPASWTATAAWTANTRTLIVTTADAIIAQDTAVQFTIADVKSPSSIRGAATAATTTQDSKDKTIDGATDIATDAIAAGTLVGTLTFVTATKTPGVRSLATISFTTAGEILQGGKIDVEMPDLSSNVQAGWRWFTATPVISFTAPGTVTGTSTWASGTRKLQVTTGGADIAMATVVTFTVAAAMTPSGI